MKDNGEKTRQSSPDSGTVGDKVIYIFVY